MGENAGPRRPSPREPQNGEPKQELPVRCSPLRFDSATSHNGESFVCRLFRVPQYETG
jgi:hypothetical protein